jgi:hypothetical protein
MGMMAQLFTNTGKQHLTSKMFSLGNISSNWDNFRSLISNGASANRTRLALAAFLELILQRQQLVILLYLQGFSSNNTAKTGSIGLRNFKRWCSSIWTITAPLVVQFRLGTPIS